MTPSARAELLKNKYSKEYVRELVRYYIKQDNEHWKQVAIELGKLYKKQQ